VTGCRVQTIKISSPIGAFPTPWTRAGRRGSECAQEETPTFTFQDDSTPGEGPFVRVLQDGLPFGKIFGTAGAYRFYEGESQKLAGSDVQHADLEVLKAIVVLQHRIMDEPAL
jgi:hypothetical protein